MRRIPAVDALNDAVPDAIFIQRGACLIDQSNAINHEQGIGPFLICLLEKGCGHDRLPGSGRRAQDLPSLSGPNAISQFTNRFILIRAKGDFLLRGKIQHFITRS